MDGYFTLKYVSKSSTTSYKAINTRLPMLELQFRTGSNLFVANVSTLLLEVTSYNGVTFNAYEPLSIKSIIKKLIGDLQY